MERSLADKLYEEQQRREFEEQQRRKEELIRQQTDPWARVALDIDGLRQQNAELRHHLEQVERRVAMQSSQIGGDQ